jgi:hypothetical protein
MISNSESGDIQTICETANQNEIKDALSRVANDKAFYYILSYLFDDEQKEKILTEIKKNDTYSGFLKEFFYPTVKRIIEKTSDGLTFSGFENIGKKESCLYISNHRDIFLDSAILQILLLENNLLTSQITFGDNLTTTNFISDIGKVNNMRTVNRGCTNKELYENSRLLSDYIRLTITSGNESVWIAQGNGRTKDGDDKTQTGLLKMLNVSGKSAFAENFKQLNIVPVSVSYEYEPCDSKKTNEIYFSLNSEYVKSPEEDLQSIVSGIIENKRHIHISAGNIIQSELNEINNISNENEKIRTLASLVDSKIISNYKLWKTNFMAFDLLNNKSQFSQKYSKKEKELFHLYIKKQIRNLKGNRKILEEIILNIYANPVKNQLKSGLI